MNLIAKLDDASPYDFTVWRGRLFVGFTYRGRYVTASASIIHGGIAHGQFAFTRRTNASASRKNRMTRR